MQGVSDSTDFSRRRFLSVALGATAAVAAPTLVTGCGSDSQRSDGKIELEFPSWQADDGTFSPWWAELVAEFERTHPRFAVNLYSLPFDSYVDQLTIRFAAGDRPDIVHLPARNAAEFAGRGWLASLQDRLAATDVPQTWTPLQEEMRLGGDDYGVLLLGYGYSLYYNEKLLDAAGHSLPTTTEEMIAAAEAITGNGVHGFGATTASHPDNYTELATFMVGNGGAISDSDGTFTVDTPTAIEGLDQYRRALAQAPRAMQSQQRNELFLNGKIAMVLDGPFFLPELDGAPESVRPQLKVARAPFEKVPGGVSNSIHISAGLDEQRADAVWDLIALATTPEWQRRYIELTKNPAPRQGSLTKAAIADTPQLALFQRLSDEADSIYPSTQEQREQFGRISDVVSEASTALITADDSTDSIAADLQAQLEETADYE